MSNSITESALRKIRGSIRRGLAPNVAILGPPGSGKNQILREVSLRLLQGDSRGGRLLGVVPIDLAGISLDSKDGMFSNLCRMILDRVQELDIEFGREHDLLPSDFRFEELLASILVGSQGLLLIVFYNLDQVPRFFARAIARRLRMIIEQSDEVQAYRRIGFLVAGSLSLFELKHETDSAFAVSETIQVPSWDMSDSISLVRSAIARRNMSEPDEGVITALAEETGGEPCFLEPLLNRLGDSVDVKTVNVVAKELGSLHSSIHELRELVFHYFLEPNFRALVERLSSGGAGVQVLFLSADIDHFHLLGAVVVDRSGPRPAYRFRNIIVARFLTGLLSAANSILSQARTHRSRYGFLGGEVQLEHSEESVLVPLEKLHQTTVAIMDCDEPAEVVNFLRDGWQITTGTAVDSIVVLLSSDAGGSRILRFETTGFSEHSFSKVSVEDRVFLGSQERQRLFFQRENGSSFVGFPITGHGCCLVVVSSITDESSKLSLNESSLAHWRRFLVVCGSVIWKLFFARYGAISISRFSGLKDEKSAPAPRAPRSLFSSHKNEEILQALMLQDYGIVISSRGAIRVVGGNLDKKLVEDLNGRCLRLGGKSQRRFREDLNGLSAEASRTLEAIPDLLFELTSGVGYKEILLLSDGEGLKFPFELLPRARSHLGIKFPISRRLVNFDSPENLAGSFHGGLEDLANRGKPLRALLIASNPCGDLNNVAGEVALVAQILRERLAVIGLKVEVRLVPPEEANVQNIESLVREGGPWHIFHFSGHGVHERSNEDESGILIADSRGESICVPLEMLRFWLEASNAWMAYLSSCHGGSVSGFPYELAQTYLGSIEAVVSAGVSVVVGFRWSVPDFGARALAGEFYKELLRIGDPQSPRVAMQIARKTAKAYSACGDAWASAVLVTQSE